ncbi:MAG: hypothetical protein ACRDTA_06885 [Pseudonocardiaceae bacterium]
MAAVRRSLEDHQVPTERRNDLACCRHIDCAHAARQIDPVDLTSRFELPDTHRLVPAAGDDDGSAAKLGAGHRHHYVGVASERVADRSAGREVPDHHHRDAGRAARSSSRTSGSVRGTAVPNRVASTASIS